MMGGRRSRLVLSVVFAASLAACVEEDGVQVSSFTLTGMEHADESELKRGLATKARGRLPWSPAAPFDQDVFEQDLTRIVRFYVDRGYPDARVDAIDVDFNDARDRVALTVAVHEGEPLIVDAVSFTGFEVLDVNLRGRLDNQLAVGQPRDRAAQLALRQQAVDLFRDHGYAYATVEVVETRTAPGHLSLEYRATAGPPTVFGPVTIAGLSDVDESIIRRQLGIRTGEPYRASRVTQSQRRLSMLEILQFVNVDARTPPEGQPREIPVRITVVEDKPRRLQLGIGYGTEDRLRGSAEWSHLNFLGDARRASVLGRWSSIERGGQIAFTQPYFLRQGLSFDATGSSWWTRERIYRADTHGGRAGVTWRLGGERRGAGRAAGDTLKLAYVYEYLRYEVRPESLAEIGSVDQLIALGLDPVTGNGRGTRTAIAADYDRAAVDNLANPRSGYAVSAHVELASPALGGSFRYQEVRGEARTYLPVGNSVFAARARAGSILASSDADVPFSQRYFLGGASSLRGWGRYEVAPLADGIPVGGRTMAEVSVELRVPAPAGLGLVGFVDAGNVWAGSLAARTEGARADVGLGIRYATPVGLIRGDAALQLTPIDGLLVNGEPSTRTWRLHVSIGHAF